MRQVVLYMAISVDGFIAGTNNETPWSDAEWDAYREFVKSCDVCIIGASTYAAMKQSDEFVEGVQYLVATNNPNLETGEYEKISISTADDLPKDGKIGVVGGGDLNGRIAKLGVIDEVILDVESVVLGAGITLFGNHEVGMQLRLKSSKLVGNNTVQNHYEVVK